MSKRSPIEEQQLVRISYKISHNTQSTQSDYNLLVKYATSNPKWYESAQKKLKSLAQGWLDVERNLGYAHCRYVNI